MTQNKAADAADDDDSLGVLDDAASSSDTAGVGILGSTAQVSVTLPHDEDDDLADDEVVDGEILSDLIIEDLVIEPATSDADGTKSAPAKDAAPATARPMDTAAKEAAPEEAAPKAAAPAEDVAPKAAPAKDAAAKNAPVKEAAPKDAAAKGAAPQGAAPKVAPAKDAASGDAAPKVAPAKDPAPEAAPAKDPAPKAAAGKSMSTPSAPTEDPAPKAGDADGGSPKSTSPRIASPKIASPSQTLPPRRPATPERTTASAIASPAAASGSAQKAKTVSTHQENPTANGVAPRTASTQPEIVLTSKRLGELGEASRESADLLTADRLLDPHRVTRPEPEGAWSHFLYTISGRRINIGDGKRARARKALSARIAAPLTGGARFVPVLSRKGGVGKTTITTLLGMALADARDDRVIAVDANPDRGTLAERIVRSHSKSVRDLVRVHDDVRGYHDISAIVARDATRLDVLASDSDPRIAEAFDDSDYRHVAEVAAHYYSLVLTDTGTGIVHSVMGATLDHADQLVIVSGLSVDEARLASETLTWLETNGHAELAREAIIVLNQSTPGSPLVRLNELEAHFSTRAKQVVRMPYDSQIAGGGAIVFANLQPETRQAARELAALLVEGLRAKAS